MKKILEYFKPKQEDNYFRKLTIKYFIIQAYAGIILIISLMIREVIFKTEDYVISQLTNISLIIFITISLFLLKAKGIVKAGNHTSLGIVVILLIYMNILQNDISVMYKFLDGFYTIIALLSFGMLLSTRPIILINTSLIFASTTRVFLFALEQAPENSDYFTTAYLNHSVTLFIVASVLFFTKKFTDATIDKINEETQIKIQQNAELEELNATKDKFFSIIAHDLRSPFNAMIGISSLLNKNFDSYDKTQQKEFISLIQEGMKNSHKLLENLLLWSRSQRGLIDFAPKKENLNTLTNLVIEQLKQSAKNKSITILNKIPEKIDLNIDRNMVSLILRNIISNAIKFTHKEGEISLSVEKAKKQYYKIKIKDNGIGFTNKKKKKLFNIAETISSKGTEKETGSGLGLILCKEFIQKHGGEIWVESEVEKGSTFILTLPAFSKENTR